MDPKTPENSDKEREATRQKEEYVSWRDKHNPKGYIDILLFWGFFFAVALRVWEPWP